MKIEVLGLDILVLTLTNLSPRARYLGVAIRVLGMATLEHRHQDLELAAARPDPSHQGLGARAAGFPCPSIRVSCPSII